jgi:diguanylate cyclase (GGDEF)-like protein
MSGQPWFLALCVLAPLYLVAVAAVNRRLHADYVALLSAERALRHQALHCGLTGLPNRTFFNQALASALHAPEHEAEHAVALLYLDLDGFKSVNDTYGHAAGDLLLQQAASRLQQVVRATDVVARLGGDEFAVLLTGPRAASAETLASTIISAVELPYDLSQGPVVRIGVSIGISECGSGICDSHALLVSADRALYIAKARGKGIFHRARPARDDGGLTTKAIPRREAVGH